MKPLDPQTLQSTLAEQTGAAVQLSDQIQHEILLNIPVAALRLAVGALLDCFEITHLTTITAQTLAEDTQKIHLMYHFWHEGQGITVQTTWVPGEPPPVSIIDRIPGADFYEREVAEMFGVPFTGREETPPLLLPDGWDGPPPMQPKETHPKETQ